MQHFKVYLRRFGRWIFREACPFWLFFIGLIMAIGLPFAFKPEPVDHTYYTGFLLQLIAFLTIIYRINTVRKYFGGRGFSGLTIDWFRRFPNIFKPPKEVKINASLGSISGEGKAAGVTVSTMKTIEEQVAALEKKQREFEKKIKELDRKLTDEISEIRYEMREQRKELKEAYKSIKKLIEMLNVESLYIEFVWMSWLVFGLILYTFPDTIGCLFA